MELPKSQKRVLIVDDNRDAADIIADYLRLCGIQALAVYDGETALHEARHFKPRVIGITIFVCIFCNRRKQLSEKNRSPGRCNHYQSEVRTLPYVPCEKYQVDQEI